MKKVIATLIVLAAGILTVNAQKTAAAQHSMGKSSQMVMKKDAPQVINLEQIIGEFVQKKVTVSPGDYIFEIENNNVGHNVGFVLVKKGSDISNPKNHIQTAYVTQQVANNSKQRSKVTHLTTGEYYYFCPLNPTATDNLLIVK
ncbi:MAG: plastocyanin/azurin family copper-binding protein [Nonlabens sp.]